MESMKMSYSKYHAIPTYVDGIRFDSKKEAKKWVDLQLMQRAGIIKNLRRQVPYTLFENSKHGRKISYKADFVYYDCTKDKEIILDTKGYRTDVYKLKKRILGELYGLEITEE